MKIKIVKCNDPLMWYYSRVGEEFQVERYVQGSTIYWCREGGSWNCLNIVNIEDTEITED